MDIARFKKVPVLGIMRGIDPEAIEPLVEAIVPARLEAIEITMNYKDAAASIRAAAKAAGKRLMVGAGTVLNMDQLKTALDAGATFIVTPVFVEDIVDYCVKNVVPVFPGALTPTEISRAWNAGATMVKVFPAGLFGPSYMREVKAPFANIELLACGGVTAENAGEYFSNGASAVAFGTGIFRKEWLAKKEFKRIGAATKKLVSAAICD